MIENDLCSLLQVISPGSAASGTNRRPQPLPCRHVVWKGCFSTFFQFNRIFNIPNADSLLFEIFNIIVLSLRDKMQNRGLLSFG